jgi:hypothetical protein
VIVIATDSEEMEEKKRMVLSMCICSECGN